MTTHPKTAKKKRSAKVYRSNALVVEVRGGRTFVNGYPLLLPEEGERNISRARIREAVREALGKK